VQIARIARRLGDHAIGDPRLGQDEAAENQEPGPRSDRLEPRRQVALARPQTEHAGRREPALAIGNLNYPPAPDPNAPGARC